MIRTINENITEPSDIFVAFSSETAYTLCMTKSKESFIMAVMGRPKSEDPKDKRVNLRMTTEQYERLKEYADKLGVSITDAVSASIEETIKKQEKKNK